MVIRDVHNIKKESIKIKNCRILRLLPYYIVKKISSYSLTKIKKLHDVPKAISQLLTHYLIKTKSHPSVPTETVL